MFSERVREMRSRFGASERQWADWRWQMRHRVTDAEKLAEFLPLSESEKNGVRSASRIFPFAITPYVLACLDENDPADPVRKQYLPTESELQDEDGEPDPLCEIDHSPVPDLVHAYPDRVALCITSRCASYCRHCFRKRRKHEQPPANAFERAVEYISTHPAIRDVLVTGGDPLLIDEAELMDKLERLRGIEHVQVLRIGTRTPSSLPMRITPGLVRKLRRFHPLFVNVQFNHPSELTPDAAEALRRLVDAGIPVGNQSVLLRDVNDDLDTMRELVHRLLACRVRPYYIFHAQLVEGTAHFRTPLEVGLEIYDGLEGHTSGLAVPLYILDTPYGKVPLSRSRILNRDENGFTIRGFTGKTWTERNPISRLKPLK